MTNPSGYLAAALRETREFIYGPVMNATRRHGDAFDIDAVNYRLTRIDKALSAYDSSPTIQGEGGGSDLERAAQVCDAIGKDWDGDSVHIKGHAARYLAEQIRALKPTPNTPSVNGGEALYEAIKHGDEVHQAWLKEAITNWFAGKPIPAPRNALTQSSERKVVVDDAMVERALYASYCEIRKEYKLSPLDFAELKACQEQGGHWTLDKGRMRAALTAALSHTESKGRGEDMANQNAAISQPGLK